MAAELAPSVHTWVRTWALRLLMGEDTLELVARARAGDAGAIEQLADRLACVSAFVRSFNRRTGRQIPEDELDDVAQNALTAIWSKLERYDGRAALESWVFGFCSREVLMAVRRRHRPGGTSTGNAEELAPSEPPSEPAEELREVEIAMLDLGPPAADIVRLKHFDGETFPEIARRLDMPLGSAKSQYYRAMERLRTRLAPLWRGMQ